MIRRFLFALLALLLTAGASASEELLPPDQAFRAALTRPSDTTLELRFQIAPGYYLYRDRISVTAEPAQTLKVRLPDGDIKDDPSFGRVAVFHRDVAMTLEAPAALPANVRLKVKFQGCADAGICYPPQTAVLAPGESSGNVDAVGALFGSSRGASSATDESGFFRGGLWLTLALFYAAGIGLALTACMYPLLPIVSSIVVGNGSNHGSRGRGLMLTAVYVQGMALTYTLAGIAAAATGTLLTVALQQPWVIAATAMLFVAMALAMFGAFQFQFPSQVQTVFNQLAHRLPGGRGGSVFAMGALSALIVGPCVAPPLVAALAYLGRTGDTWLGGASLYALALGIGTPLMIVGAFGATMLPRLSLRVMRAVKMLFGVVLLGTAVWMARPLWLHYLPQGDVPAFRNVASVAELDRALADARGKPVMLDMYADWCTSCVEFERQTLTDAGVRRRLQSYVLLRADLTGNSPDDAALLRHFGLYGPPALLFYDRDGRLLPRRVVGFQDATAFSATLDSLP
ncbi:protein-disulfide reductase DsbD [Chitiniphilus eburneus]|uniref:Protein-disulfide reductase DsbD n=1 Tax=Chitiniphilus eburneus TaxID=2571148 RepID=A0A4U0Q390_9NEIS|nr:protein-disulfide reductase DsbD [Chitiniphilus eburneus]TJZ75516.1 protein-disulfide reductase DsbD [Chitiniphilus eburneus]